MTLRLLALAAAITAQPLVDEDVLEPSVENEVEHALSLAPTNASSAATARETALLATNGLSRTAIAIRLVSLQRADGRFYVGTNDVTAAAAAVLSEL